MSVFSEESQTEKEIEGLQTKGSELHLLSIITIKMMIQLLWHTKEHDPILLYHFHQKNHPLPACWRLKLSQRQQPNINEPG